VRRRPVLGGAVLPGGSYDGRNDGLARVRDGHAVFDPLPGRPDPIGLPEEQAKSRVPELAPSRPASAGPTSSTRPPPVRGRLRRPDRARPSGSRRRRRLRTDHRRTRHVTSGRGRPANVPARGMQAYRGSRAPAAPETSGSGQPRPAGQNAVARRQRTRKADIGGTHDHIPGRPLPRAVRPRTSSSSCVSRWEGWPATRCGRDPWQAAACRPTRRRYCHAS